ncbi:MAG: SDR family NAD(P)-dependent oxidoreductase [Pseudomonadota bacterium]
MTSEMEARSHRALVTGAGRRIGRTIALRLAEDGWNVAVHCYGSVEEAHRVVKEIEAKGRSAVVLQADLLDPAVGGSLVEAACKRLGPLSLLVNSASFYGSDSLATLTPESWRRLLDINLTGQVFMMQAFARQRPLPEGASIVNLLDQQMNAPSPAYFSYFVAKFGLAGATKLAALELAPAVRVNGVAPGLTLPSAGQTEDEFRARQGIMPLGAGLGAGDVADAVSYLAKAWHVTGEVIHVDSGQRLMGMGNSELRLQGQ